MASPTLTEQQIKFLEECEEEFKNRYTDDDPDFLKRKNSDKRMPPIIDPWYNKPRRPQYDWANRNQGGRRNWDNRRYNERERNDRSGGRHFSSQARMRPY